MSTKPTNPTQPERQPTAADIAADKVTQHFHRVFGADAAHRNSSQKHVVEWLEGVVNCPVFTRGQSGFCNTVAALNEGQRILANQILTNLKKSAVEITTKPTVTK